MKANNPRRKRYTVFLSRDYALPADKPKEICAPLAATEILAETRREAAYRAWNLYGIDWIKLCTTKPRKISLHSGPKGSVTEAAFRMEPIQVFPKI